MEKETNQNKKIKIKANLSKQTFLLKKEFIYEENETFILNKVVQKRIGNAKKAKKNQINLATSNIIKLNEQ